MFPSNDLDDVIGWLNRLDSDRLQVAVLVGATWHGKPFLKGKSALMRVRDIVETALVDDRDVLMNEYDERIDYKGELKRLGLDRPYPL